jgi:hypothetical protein
MEYTLFCYADGRLFELISAGTADEGRANLALMSGRMIRDSFLLAEVDGDKANVIGAAGNCRWFAACANDATTAEIGPGGTPVPTCERCSALVAKHSA